MNKKKTTFLAVAALASCMAIGTVTFVGSAGIRNDLVIATGSTYGFTLNAENATVTDGEVVATATGNNVALAFTGASESAGNFCALATGGTISNTREVLGITKLTLNFTGSVKVYGGALKGHWTTQQEVTASGDVVMIKAANYFKIEALADTAIASVQATYVCDEADPEGETHTLGDSYTVADCGDTVKLTKICSVCNEPAGPSYSHAKVSAATGSWNYKDGTYGFEVNADGWYVSTNHNVNSSKAKAVFTCESAGSLTFDYYVSGEGTSSYWDYLEITKTHNGSSTTVLKKTFAEGTMSVDLDAGDTLTFTYSKDSSTSNEPDCAKFKVAPSVSTYNALTLNSMGGNELEPILILNGKATTALPTPVRDGYTFLGWYYESVYTNAVGADATFTADTIIYAKWFDNADTHPLAGTYKGWYLKPYSSTTSNYSSSKSLTISVAGQSSGDFTEDITSFATATGLGETSNYNVSVNAETGAIFFVPKTGFMNGMYAFYKDAASNGSAKGYTFALNDTVAEGETAKKVVITEITNPDTTKDYMLYDTMSGSFHFGITTTTMDGTGPSSYTNMTGIRGWEFAASGMTSVKIGYNPSDSKWYTADNRYGAYKLAGASTNTLFVNGVASLYEGTSVSAGTKYSYIDGDTNNEIIYTDSSSVSTSYTLDLTNKTYAKAAKNITVSFDMGGHGTQCEPITKGWNCWVYTSDLPTPTADGWAFVGWYTDAALSQAYTQSKFKANVTLYAKWASALSITLVYNDGRDNKVVNVPEGNTPSLETPVRSGYCFKGWYYDNETFENKYVAGPLEANITLYAKWEVLPAIVGSWFGYNFDNYGSETGSTLGRSMTINDGSITGIGEFDWADYNSETGLLSGITSDGFQMQFLTATDGTMFAIRGYSFATTPYSSTDMDIYVKADEKPTVSIGTFGFTPGSTSTGRFVKMVYWTMNEKTYRLWVDCQKAKSWIDVTFENGDGTELAAYSDFYSGSIVNDALTVKDKAGTVIASYVRNGTQFLKVLDGYQGTYNGTIRGQASTIVLNGAGSATINVGAEDAITGTYTIADDVATIVAGGKTYLASLDKTAMTFTLAKDGYEGTYTGANGDLVLDGYGLCTYNSVSGTYSTNGNLVTVKCGEDTVTLELDRTAKTYSALSEWAGRSFSGTWDSEWDEASNTITVTFDNSSAIKGTLKSSGHYTNVNCTFTTVIEGSTMTMTIVTGSVSYLATGKQMVWTIGTNGEGKMTLTAVSNDIGRSSTEQFGYPVGLVLTLA